MDLLQHLLLNFLLVKDKTRAEERKGHQTTPNIQSM